MEDIVRKRSGLTESSTELFEKAFRSGRPKPQLYWNVVDTGEKDGRINLFKGAYMAHRNPRAHSELRSDESVTEFLLLNHLYLLERESRKADLGKGAIEFRDIVGSLKVLHITCAKCGRQSEDELKHLIERDGLFGNIDNWLNIATFDCPRRKSKNDHDPCGAICPDLPKVV